MRVFLIMFLVALGCETSVAPPPPPPERNAAYIGLIMPLSGPAVIGPWDWAARLAIREINEAGGINHQRLDLIARDSREGLPGAAEIVRAAVNELADSGAVVVAGPGFSSSIVAVLDTVVARRVPLVGLTTTSPTISTLSSDHLIYRVVPSDAFQGGVLANRIRRDGIDTLAIIHRDDVYGNGLAVTLRARFELEGGRVLADVPYPPQKTHDFDAEVMQLLAPTRPGSIAIVGTSLDSAAIVTALQARNPIPKPGLYGVDGNATDVFLANVPAQFAVGMRGTTSASPVDIPNFKKWDAAYRAAVGAGPALGLENAYDVVYLAALAMIQGRANTAAAVHAHLRDVSRPISSTPLQIGVGTEEFRRATLNVGGDFDYQGASGAIDFAENGDRSDGTYRIWEIVQGPSGLRLIDRERVSFP